MEEEEVEEQEAEERQVKVEVLAGVKIEEDVCCITVV